MGSDTFRFEAWYYDSASGRTNGVQWKCSSSLDLLDRLLRSRRWDKLTSLRILPTDLRRGDTFIDVNAGSGRWDLTMPGANREKIEEMAQIAWDTAMRRVDDWVWNYKWRRPS